MMLYSQVPRDRKSRYRARDIIHPDRCRGRLHATSPMLLCIMWCFVSETLWNFTSEAITRLLSLSGPFSHLSRVGLRVPSPGQKRQEIADKCVQSDALLAAGSGSCAINPEKFVRCFSWNQPIAAFTHLHQIERSLALSRSSASVLPGAGGNLRCETVDGTIGEERNAEGKCFPVDNGQSNCLAHSRRAEGYTSKFKKKGKLLINSTMRDNLMNRFHFS